jgi:HSP20 family molecular chaperone IbpA
MTETRVAKSDEKSPSATAGEEMQKTETPEMEAIYAPEVDITENNDCIRLVADMPGIDQKSVDVTVENNVLTIEGRGQVDPPEGYELVGREYGVGKYRRDFTLPDAVAADKIKARVRHGVVEVTIPKREELKTRKIAIES